VRRRRRRRSIARSGPGCSSTSGFWFLNVSTDPNSTASSAMSLQRAGVVRKSKVNVTTLCDSHGNGSLEVLSLVQCFHNVFVLVCAMREAAAVVSALPVMKVYRYMFERDKLFSHVACLIHAQVPNMYTMPPCFYVMHARASS